MDLYETVFTCRNDRFLITEEFNACDFAMKLESGNQLTSYEPSYS